MHKCIEKFKKNRYLWLVVGALFILGIFLRTYKYHDLLRFNADQGRDSELVSDVINGKTALPLLGPKAGGTTFKLGPIFYYFQIISAKVLGNYPDKMAYPDLFAGILCIPLLYFFLRKYFDWEISLAMAGIFCVSEFAIRWARFAWNPNSTPFWILIVLYSLHELVSKKNKRKFLWALICGLAVGVGIQLHSMLLFSLPITLVIIFGYLLIKKNKAWKYFFVIFAMVLLLNASQILYEYSSGGENTRAFLAGMQKKESSQGTLIENFWHGNSALAQIVPNILTGYEISDGFAVEFNKKHSADVAVVVLGALFTLGGLVLFARYLRKEKDVDKKAFLGIIAIYSIIAYLIFAKLSFETSVRMYLVIFFVPYFLLGFWLKFLREKNQKRWLVGFLSVIIFFIAINLFFDKAYFTEFEGYEKGSGSVNISTLGGMEVFSQFIAKYSNNEPEAYISGNKKFFFINYSPLRYLMSNGNIKLTLIGTKEIRSLTVKRFFYIALENKLNELATDPDYKVIQSKQHGKFTIFLLEKKP